MRSGRKAFTIIELLVVVLVLGILTALGLPSYISTLQDSRHKTANANTRAIAVAVKSLYIKTGMRGYVPGLISETAITQELGGSVPINPCTGGNSLSTDYQLVREMDVATLQAAPGANCSSVALTEMRLTR